MQRLYEPKSGMKPEMRRTGLYRDVFRVASTRLNGWDYSSAGIYVVTICTRGHFCFFGDIVDGEVLLTLAGQSAYRCWAEIPTHFPGARLDEFVVMPNHVHGIVALNGNLPGPSDGDPAVRREVACNLSTTDIKAISPKTGTLGVLIRSYKAAVSKWCHSNGSPNFAWQERYYDHIVRDEWDLNRVREYILLNPRKWDLDRENPDTLL